MTPPAPPGGLEPWPPPPAGEEPLAITPDMLAPPTGQPGGSRTDFELGISYLPGFTILLIVANIAVFAWELAAGALASQEAILHAGALHRGLVLQGEIWRLASAMFLHGGIGHLVGNCLVLYIVGMALEHGAGTRRTMAVYFGSGLCGSILSIVASPGPSVGASGAIFGLAGGVVAFLYRNQDRFYVRDKRIGLVLAIWAGYQILTGFASPMVDNFAHLGGLLGGVVLIWGAKPFRQGSLA